MSDHSSYQSPARKGSHTITEILPSLFFVHRGFLNGNHFVYLMNTVWFPETCAFFFNGEHRRKFDEVMAGLIRRRIVTCTDGKLFTQVAA